MKKAERDIWGKNGRARAERGIYRKYLFLREVSRRNRERKEDKEYIEGNRDKKCPGETKRSFFSVLGKDRGVSA